MTVLHEILEWSKSRYPWQREALRRLVVGGELSNEDVQELGEFCKAAHGLAEPHRIVPLAREHVPDEAETGTPVSLDSIFHYRGVNALAENQTLRFSPHLTVVYGDNAAGKTGYIRILKSACRARGQEQILGNVVSGVAPHAPVVAIKYRVGSEPETREWEGNGDDEFISRVSVFDTRCAAVYLTEKTEVAFRPFGLDVFDKLVRACKAIRTQLEKEQRSLASKELAHLQAQVPEGTAVAKLLSNINSLTKPETVQELSRLSPEDETRLALLERSLLDLKANDPEKLRRELALRAERVETLARHVRAVETELSPASVEDAVALRETSRRIYMQATKLRESAFTTVVLPGTGSGSWSSLWEAARKFSEELAYPEEPFPAVGDGARCVLCQQDLDHAARHRLETFEAFVASTAEHELREVRDAWVERRSTFTDLEVIPEHVKEILAEVRIEHEALSDAIAAALAAAENRRRTVSLALREDGELAENCPDLKPVAAEVDALATQMLDRVAALQARVTPESQENMTYEAQEFRARKVLAQHEGIVLDEIERKRKYAAYELCLRVRPETLCRITEFSEHESNGRELDEGERVAVEVLPVLGQSAAAVEPGDGAFDHPTPGLDDEALHPIGSLDDLGLEIGQDAGQGAVKDRPLIGAVGEQFPEKGKQTEQGRQQRETAVAILNVGGGDDAVQQQALRIDQNMPLLALDQLAGIEAVAVDASPPFSALFTL